MLPMVGRLRPLQKYWGWRFYILASIFVSALLPFVSSASEWKQNVGLGSILNPEGSRLFPQAVIYPRHPGKPDPRWKNFSWKWAERKQGNTRYRLYFYEGEEEAARFVLPQIDQEIQTLAEQFNYQPNQIFSYLLFSTLSEFQQANLFSISEGVQGITSTTEPTMAIPFWGELGTFRHISTHEMVHQFQIQKIRSLSEKRAAPELSIPLWFIEGMAEYLSLGGLDKEAKGYLRDLVQNPDKKRQYSMPGFFENGPMDFVRIYKVGQAKIAFLEETFGHGTSQKILEASAREITSTQGGFEAVTSSQLALSVKDLEEKWKSYVEKNFRIEDEFAGGKVTLGKVVMAADAELLGEPSRAVDEFQISPNGQWIATRELDPLSGVVSIRVRSLQKNKNSKAVTVARDQQSFNVSLGFLQFPAFSLGNSTLVFVVRTELGPELEWVHLSAEREVVKRTRVALHEAGLTQASTPVLSPNEKRVAFIGINSGGWQQVYELPNETEKKPIQLTPQDTIASWRGLAWRGSQLVGASDPTTRAHYNLVEIPSLKKLSPSSATQINPSVRDGLGSLVFESDESGSAQIHELLPNGEERQLTRFSSWLTAPQVRNGKLYALGMQSGLFRIFEFDLKELQEAAPTVQALRLPRESGAPWIPHWADLNPQQVKRYRPFRSGGIRLDELSGFLGSGTMIGLNATVSDLMRNWVASGELLVLGSAKWSNASLFLTNQAGRSTWTLGAYQAVQTRLDTTIPDSVTRLYRNSELGVLGALQQPLSYFSFYDLELRLASVGRSDYDDPATVGLFNAKNSGRELLISPMLRLGSDNILYELYTGPIQGTGALLEADTSFYPQRGAIHERLRGDFASYTKIRGRSVLALQAMAGSSFSLKGDPSFLNPFLVSSDDLFRSYLFSDNRLRGRYLLGAKAEWRFPLGIFFNFPPIRGIFAWDVGSIWREGTNLRETLTTSTSAGISLNFPPIGLSILASFPGRIAPGPRDVPVIHFALRYLYL